jgi:dipeptidyl aminopeptidase/acylaminoacyl peptidase
MSIPPTPKPSTGYPVVILAHGYIDPSTYSTTGTDYQPWINALCNAGYLILKPDFRGNGASQGSPVGGHFSPAYTYDLLNLVASLHTLPEANLGRVALIGHSMGADVVLRTLVASHNLPIKAAILVSGVVASLQDIAYSWPNSPPDVVSDKASFIQTYGSPQQNPSVWHDASSINYVSSITAAVQIDVGNADTVVPPAFSASLSDALTNAKIPHEYFVYPEADHQFSDSASSQSLLIKAIQFLNSNL